MLNKLESADDHRDKPLPRPKWNVDTVRAGIIVHDAALLAQVYDAIAANVGIFLRVKNAFAEGAVVNYGYRAILGNLRLESVLTVRRVFGGVHADTWWALAKAREAIDAAAPEKMDAVLEALRPLLEDAETAKVGQHLKYDANVLANHGITLRGIHDDTMLESYILDAAGSRHDLDTLALKYLGQQTIHFEDIAGKGAKQLTFNQVPIEQV